MFWHEYAKIPVSYTHLVVDAFRISFAHSNDAPARIALDASTSILASALWEWVFMIPVSYTHLDVYKRQVYYIKKLSVLAEIIVVASCLLVFALTIPVTKLGGMESESARMCFHMISWITVVKPIVWTLAFIPAYGLRAAGDVKFSMLTSCITMWTFRFCLCVYLIRFRGFGPMAVWIGMFTDWTVRGIVFSLRFHSRKWLKHKVV